MEKVLLTKENIEDYCRELETQGRRKQTVKTYYNSLSLLYEYLPVESLSAESRLRWKMITTGFWKKSSLFMDGKWK